MLSAWEPYQSPMSVQRALYRALQHHGAPPLLCFTGLRVYCFASPWVSPSFTSVTVWSDPEKALDGGTVACWNNTCMCGLARAHLHTWSIWIKLITLLHCACKLALSPLPLACCGVSLLSLWRGAQVVFCVSCIPLRCACFILKCTQL